MTIAISPYSTTTTKPLPHNYDTKVILFWERFHGWKLDIAKKLINGYTDQNVTHPGIMHSGYAALDIIFSAFEPLGKHMNGYLDTNGPKSGHHFKEGVKTLVDTTGQNQADVDKLIDSLWSGVRCGLYHCGQTKGKIIITSAAHSALGFDTTDEITVINPHLLVDAMTIHFENYKKLLIKEGASSDLGVKFIARYDFENA